MRPTAVILALWGMTRTRIDATWLVALDKEPPYLFAVDHSGDGMYEYLRGCYADFPPRKAALPLDSDYGLERDDALWRWPGVLT